MQQTSLKHQSKVDIHQDRVYTPVMTFLLFLAAFVCFVLATFNVSAKINLVAAGLALATLTVILPTLLRLGGS